ncbi:MAG TPA: polysaccharide export protein [Methylophaga aminisulfidivorans]|uniref:polysaccharide biosynthesis/export family protein n=1 Tax=Methylophaga TaxID=40222 RepID=UPI0017529871|nr:MULTISPECIES: polysaccharide biosynthesis/export family protein [Methylophaga]HIC47880.1 polysaccharide export protein [Methylophaga sp.]HIM39293.1 polysaccharide export protein [Methylophaga aminisulfidivorans]
MLKRFLVLLVTIVSLFSSSVFAAERYLLNSGDVLDISVWNEESLQKQVTVLPDGVITFPLAGEVVAKDKTVAEVEEELTKKLSEYLADPVVTVSVTNVEGNRVHILGKVLNPGSFVMNQPLDAMQALSLAGGLSPYAEENNIIVLRRDGAKQQVLPVKYAEIKKGKALNTNITLESGDVIIVP